MKVTPLILVGRASCPEEPEIDAEYDAIRDQWVGADGRPLILLEPRPRTTLTKSMEGVDQSEGVDVRLSMRTMITATREGIDQGEGTDTVFDGPATSLPRTMITLTAEGIDQSGEGSEVCPMRAVHPSKSLMRSSERVGIVEPTLESPE